MAESDEPAPIAESARSVYEAARNVAGAWGGTFAALRRLLAADLALAREALIRGLLMLFLAAIMFGTMWVLLTAFTVWLLFKIGLGAGVALGLPLLVSAIIGAIALLHAAKALKLADMEASRHELAQWIETVKTMPDPETDHPARSAPPRASNPSDSQQP